MEWWSLRIFFRCSEPRRRVGEFVSRWSWSDECWFFLDSVFLTEFCKVTYTCSSNYRVYDGECTYTHLLHAHFFCCTMCLRTLAHFSCVSHTRMAEGCQKILCTCVTSRLFQSHVSPILVVPWWSLRDHSWLWRPHVLAVLTCPESAGHAHPRTSSEEFGYLAKSALSTGYEPKNFDKITSVDNDTMLIDDPDHDGISDFSKTKRENTGLFGVPSVWNLCFARFSW